MLALPLFAAASLALAPTGASFRFELSLGAEFAAESVTLPRQTLLPDDSLFSAGGQGGVGLTVYATRVFDDDAPPSLQPYLQRVSELHVDGGASGYSASPSTGGQLLPGTGYGGHVDLDGTAYLDRFFFASLGAGVRYRSDTRGSGLYFATTTETIAVPVGIAAGPRFGDLRLALGWGVTPTRVGDDVFRVPFWGNVDVEAYGVVRRRLVLRARVDVYDGGAGAIGNVAVYLARRFELGAFVRGSQEHIYQTTLTDAHAGAGLDFEAWTGPRFAIELSDSFDWNRYTDKDSGAVTETDYTNVISLSFRLRPR
ncbi:MAG TPA: hypothetical protein VN947_14145 [Polyangia bacterium]|nr:hypothetical protein [Polyangia bacterium]